MAMSRDRGTQSQACDWGYGALREPGTGRWLSELAFVSANQEHGVLQATAGLDVVAAFPVGTLLEILPNHACATAAQFADCELQPAGERWTRLNAW
jgi:D-serine deaminase-like pyridoxal phosphate-dependent protein